jgi:transposase
MTRGAPKNPALSDDAIRIMRESGMRMQQIADAGKVSVSTIARRMAAIEAAGKAQPRKAKVATPASPAPRASSAAQADALARTGGRYAALDEWARANGLTHQQALIRWHRLRLPLQTGDRT